MPRSEPTKMKTRLNYPQVQGEYSMNIVLEQSTWRNENAPDRIIRVMLGLVFFQLAFFG